MSKKDKGFKYTLTIMYKPGEDQCEFIQEELIDDTDDDTSWTYGELDLRDYFSESDLACFTCDILGKS